MWCLRFVAFVHERNTSNDISNDCVLEFRMRWKRKPTKKKRKPNETEWNGREGARELARHTRMCSAVQRDRIPFFLFDETKEKPNETRRASERTHTRTTYLIGLCIYTSYAYPEATIGEYWRVRLLRIKHFVVVFFIFAFEWFHLIPVFGLSTFRCAIWLWLPLPLLLVVSFSKIFSCIIFA